MEYQALCCHIHTTVWKYLALVSTQLIEGAVLALVAGAGWQEILSLNWPFEKSRQFYNKSLK